MGLEPPPQPVGRAEEPSQGIQWCHSFALTLEILLPESQSRFFISLYKFKIQHLKGPLCILEHSWFHMLVPRLPQTVLHVERGDPSSLGRVAGSAVPGTSGCVLLQRGHHVQRSTGGNGPAGRRCLQRGREPRACIAVGRTGSVHMSHPGCWAGGCRGRGGG